MTESPAEHPDYENSLLEETQDFQQKLFADEINLAMDQVTQFEQPQPDPWKEQEDLYKQCSIWPIRLGCRGRCKPQPL